MGTNYINFDGSSEPNGLYLFELAISVSQRRTGTTESMTIRGVKF